MFFPSGKVEVVHLHIKKTTTTKKKNPSDEFFFIIGFIVITLYPTNKGDP